ncbi:unnamed protein product, partial [Didymodactylos carnosus]
PQQVGKPTNATDVHHHGHASSTVPVSSTQVTKPSLPQTLNTTQATATKLQQQIKPATKQTVPTGGVLKK